ncbi:MAG: hypothetical protein HKN21_06040 [Candidatus Eisenbacteria bacterium]|uniref:Aromatic hydrocarbon degradation protein n=1 Tax=Eiseniibacteriota bacterium TaxID=2212470 RepID=A0A7Y2EAC2_UNCEI|nr:hypothetical protein [Candidatus Eisenbacteria bacterium]
MRSFMTTLLLALCLAGLGVSPTQAQLTGSDTPVELLETSPFGMGARAMGMGQAFIAVGDDLSGIAYNPATISQIRRMEFNLGLTHDNTKHGLRRSGFFETERSDTRIEQIAVAYPHPVYRGALVWGFGFHRMADLTQDIFSRGVVDPNTATEEIEDVVQTGAVNAWTGAAAIELTENLSVGASLSYLSGSRDEDLVLARGIDDPDAGGCPGLAPDEYGLFYGCGDPSEESLYKSVVRREATLDGFTGAVGVLAKFENGVRLGGKIDLPKWMRYQGTTRSSLENYLFTEESDASLFEDDITLPLSVGAGASWAKNGLTLAADLTWTDWSQTDFEGDILVPSPSGREFAYRSVAKINLGAEYFFADFPVQVRGGFFTEPLPYKLIAADGVSSIDPGADNVLGTEDDISSFGRFYPEADIVSDRKFVTLGAGIFIHDRFIVDVAFVTGNWERRTEDGFDAPSGFPTIEEVTQNRLFLTSTLRFD